MANGSYLGNVCYAQTNGPHIHHSDVGGASRTTAIVLATLAAVAVVIGIVTMNQNLLAHTVARMTPYFGKVAVITGSTLLGALAVGALIVRLSKPILPEISPIRVTGRDAASVV